MKRFALLLLLAAGCYREPDGLPWTGDKTTATHCDLSNGIAVDADGPVYCAAITANWQMAHGAILARGWTSEEEWQLMTKKLYIEVKAHQRCLDLAGASSSCVYEYTNADAQISGSYWTPAQIVENENGTQIAHEMLHVVCAWNNVPSNDHQGWDQNGYMEFGREMADRAYHITP